LALLEHEFANGALRFFVVLVYSLCGVNLWVWVWVWVWVKEWRFAKEYAVMQ
jgi:hypothetical protein